MRLLLSLLAKIQTTQHIDELLTYAVKEPSSTYTHADKDHAIINSVLKIVHNNPDLILGVGNSEAHKKVMRLFLCDKITHFIPKRHHDRIGGIDNVRQLLDAVLQCLQENPTIIHKLLPHLKKS